MRCPHSYTETNLCVCWSRAATWWVWLESAGTSSSNSCAVVPGVYRCHSGNVCRTKPAMHTH